MKAISKRQHQSLMEAFKQLENLLQADEAITDGFIAQKQSLVELYQRYETLLTDLAECIRKYEEEHHLLKVNVVAPALRQARKMAKTDKRKCLEIQQYVKVARAI